NLTQIQSLNQNIKLKEQTIQDNLTQIQSLNQNIKLKEQTIQDNLTQIQLSNNQLLFCIKYGTAKNRIKNQLSYKLGQAMIINSRTFLGCLIMPIVLLSIVVSHKQEQKIYKQKIKKDSSLILPHLEQYPDYKESIELKNHLSYKLGQALIKASKTWYKGGFIYFLANINKIKVRIK
ncbi:alpha-2,3-sialyltransferase, partial [Campylobacter coli]